MGCAAGDDSTISEEEEGATCEAVRTHADTELSLGLSVGGGMIEAG